jgi:hypothetical protein
MAQPHHETNEDDSSGNPMDVRTEDEREDEQEGDDPDED